MVIEFRTWVLTLACLGVAWTIGTRSHLAGFITLGLFYATFRQSGAIDPARGIRHPFGWWQQWHSHAASVVIDATTRQAWAVQPGVRHWPVPFPMTDRALRAVPEDVPVRWTKHARPAPNPYAETDEWVEGPRRPSRPLWLRLGGPVGGAVMFWWALTHL